MRGRPSSADERSTSSSFYQSRVLGWPDRLIFFHEFVILAWRFRPVESLGTSDSWVERVSVKEERPPVFHRPPFDVDRAISVGRNALAPVHLPGGSAVEGALEATRQVGHVGVVAVAAVGIVA